MGILLRGVVARSACCHHAADGRDLPAISRWVESSPEGVSWLGFFYGGNIAGGVLGTVAAGFYLLRVYDLGIATYVAVALNVTVALLAIGIAKATPVPERLESDRDVEAPAPAPGAWAVYVAIALSGATALSSEVIWTRLLSLLFGGTVYTFALILAVFLFGLGIGSSLGAAIGRRAARPRVAFGWCQMFLCAAIAWSAYMLTQSLLTGRSISSITTDPWFNFQLDFVRCSGWSCRVDPVGRELPAGARLGRPSRPDPARLVGGVYAANTVGAIVGSLCASLLLVVWLGSQHAQQLLLLVSALSGPLVLSTGGADEPAGVKGSAGFQLSGTLAVIAAAACAGLLSRTVQPLPGIFAAYGRYTATRLGQADVKYVGEGWTATIAVTSLPGGVLNYHNAGKVQASSDRRTCGCSACSATSPRSSRRRREGRRHRLRRGRDRRRGVDRSRRHRSDHRRDRSRSSRRSCRSCSASNFHVVDNPKVHVRIDDARHYLRPPTKSSTPSPRTRWIRGSRARHALHA